jgi:hypothetical protein
LQKYGLTFAGSNIPLGKSPIVLLNASSMVATGGRSFGRWGTTPHPTMSRGRAMPRADGFGATILLHQWRHDVWVQDRCGPHARWEYTFVHSAGR